MKTYFDDLRQIETPEFLSKYATHVNSREKPDPFEIDVFEGLKKSVSYLTCYLARLNEKGIDNLILPHHATTLEPEGPDTDRAVKDGGDTFRNVANNFLRYIPASRFPKCVKKIQEQKSYFSEKIVPYWQRTSFLYAMTKRQPIQDTMTALMAKTKFTWVTGFTDLWPMAYGFQRMVSGH